MNYVSLLEYYSTMSLKSSDFQKLETLVLVDIEINA